MAYAALNSLMVTLEQILLQPDRYLIPYEKQHVECLHKKLGYLQDFLEDLSPEGHEMTGGLEKRMRDATYEAEDITDLYLINEMPGFHVYEKEMELRNYLMKPGHGDFQNIIDEFDSIIQEMVRIKDKLGSDMREKFDSLVEEATEIESIGRNDLQSWSSLHAGSSKLGSSGNNLMVGLDNYRMQINDQLINQHSSSHKVISIIGMGGIGKTFLATSIYNDPLIVYHFDIRAWVTVSQSYCTRNILLSILSSMKNLSDMMYQESDDQLGLRLYQTLAGKRYLIVIDDIWDSDAWDGVRRMFPNGNSGSRIIVTTRISDVAACCSSSGPLHQMSLLSDDLSWILLRAKAFGEKPCPINLQELGMQIAKKCQGLPLSIVVVGGLLSRLNITHEAWQDIAENITSIVNSSDDQCLEILRLSYNYLPQHLMACFLYLGAFQENHEISVSKITKLWLGESFLKQDKFQSLEEGAERCLKELSDRNLILVSKQNFNGIIKRFRIHDLLRKFCVNEAKDERFLQVINSGVNKYAGNSHCLRRTSIDSSTLSMSDHFNSMPSVSFARSLIFTGKHYFLPSDFFPRFKLLKVLDAIQVEFLQFPFEILELLNLRYVAFMCHGEIPASISKLRSLQTLIIHQEVFLFLTQKYRLSLPVEIWEMHHLRHVEFTIAYLMDPIREALDIDEKCLVLKDLQTVSGIRNLRFTEDLLKRIANIKKLEISYDDVCWWEKGWSYYHLENLVNLHELEALKITVIPYTFTWSTHLIPLPESFSFSPTLKILTLCGCEIPWDDLESVGSLPNLEELRLKDKACIGEEWEPNESGFRQLKLLKLENLNLNQWKADRYCFPCLKRLVLRHCFYLEEIPYDMGYISTLTTVELDESDGSLLTSAQDIKELQISIGNDEFQVVVQKFELKDHILRGAPFRV